MRKEQLPVIAKDTIKELLFDCVGFRSREEKVNLGTASMEIMYYAAGQAQRNGREKCFLMRTLCRESGGEDLMRFLLAVSG